jgi:hypothetical protein
MGADGPFPDWEQEAERRDRAAGRRERPTDASQVGGYEQAAVDRAAAAQDRAAAAGDERAAAADRETARGDRVAAQDRSGAAGDREQAAVERAQHRYVPAPDGSSYRRVQAVHDGTQETTRAAAGLVERFLQAKQRELAAHLASIEVHEQLASLQEGLGHPDRAAEARARAERAREFHRLAGAELAAYLARIKAVENRRASRRRDGIGRAGG